MKKLTLVIALCLETSNHCSLLPLGICQLSLVTFSCASFQFAIYFCSRPLGWLWHWGTQSCLTQPPPLYAPVLAQVGDTLCMWPKTTNGNWKPFCFTGAFVFCKSGIQRGISENIKLVCSRPYFSCLLCVDRTNTYNGPIPKSPTIVFTRLLKMQNPLAAKPRKRGKCLI
jgi:hypothetical protein